MARKNRLSLTDLADLTGGSIAMFSRVERGERNFSALEKVRIARVLRLRVRDLFPPEVNQPEYKVDGCLKTQT